MSDDASLPGLLAVRKSSMNSFLEPKEVEGEFITRNCKMFEEDIVF
jgi:hypothetical protein